MSEPNNDDVTPTLDELTIPLNEAVRAENIGKLLRSPAIIVSEADPRAIPIRATCLCRNCATAARLNADFRPTEVVARLYDLEKREITREEAEKDVFYLILAGQISQATRLLQKILQRRAKQQYQTHQNEGTAPECRHHDWVFSWDKEISLNVVPAMVRILLRDELAFYSIRQTRDYHAFFLFQPPMEMRVFLWAVPFPNPSQKNRIDLIIVNLEPIEEERQELTTEEIEEWQSHFSEEALSPLMQTIDQNLAPEIVQRELYKTTMFLTLHSPLWFEKPSTQPNKKTQLMRAALRFGTYGDTATAKTELMTWCEDVLKLGEVVRAETGTRAGMYYHVNPEIKALYWGAVPQNDGGVVYIDGLQGYSPEEMAKLREVFTHQKIKVQMMVSGEAWARVRMVGAANTKRPMRTFLFRCQGILDVRPFSREYSLPDIRRWDGWVPACQEDVESQAIADATLPINNPIEEAAPVSSIDPQLIRKHIVWAWSLKPDEIFIEPEAQKELNTAFVEIKQAYESPSIPVVHAGYWETITRYAIAFAVLCHKWNEETHKIYVDPTSVHLARGFIKIMFNTLQLGDYVQFEKGQRLLQTEIADILLDLDDTKMRLLQELAKRPRTSPELGAVVGLKPYTVRTNYLSKLRALELVDSGTRKGFKLTEKGVELLRYLKDRKFELPEKPSAEDEEEKEEWEDSKRCESCGNYFPIDDLKKHPYDLKGRYCPDCLRKLTPEGGALDDF